MAGQKTYDKFTNNLLRLAISRRSVGSVGNTQSKNPTIFSFERRRVLIPLVNKHKGILLQKMPNLNLNDLVNSIGLIFEKNFEKYTRAANVQWLDQTKDALLFTNLKAMEAVLAKFRFEVRQQAIANINKSKRTQAQQDNDISTALVLGGIDPRLEGDGGDIRSSDLKNGLLISKGSTGKDSAIGNNRLANLSKENGTGFQAGHAFGPGLESVRLFTGSATHPSPILDLFDADIQKQLIGFREVAVKLDASFIINQRLFSRSGAKEGEITIIFAEASGTNALSGALLGTKVLVPLRELLDAQDRELEKEFEKLVTTYSASPTILEQYIKALEGLFLTGKLKRKNSRRVFKTSKKYTFKIPEYGPKVKPTKAGTRRKAEKETSGLNLQDLIALLNARLHDQIRQNMGKGNSKSTLNYRTGRFAKSAKVEMLTSSLDKGAIVAQVKYMRNPYGVFEIGGKLNPPKLRDPAHIFGISIRQILQEEKIATLRRVKVNLSG